MKKLFLIIVCCLCLCGCGDKEKEENYILKCIKVDNPQIQNIIMTANEVSLKCKNNIILNSSQKIRYSYYFYEDALNDKEIFLKKEMYNKCNVEKGETGIGILTCDADFDIKNTNTCDEYRSYITSNGYACEDTE